MHSNRPRGVGNMQWPFRKFKKIQSEESHNQAYEREVQRSIARLNVQANRIHSNKERVREASKTIEEMVEGALRQAAENDRKKWNGT